MDEELLPPQPQAFVCEYEDEDFISCDVEHGLLVIKAATENGAAIGPTQICNLIEYLAKVQFYLIASEY
jgi:hypothetical protein